MSAIWKKCTVCKKDIPVSTTYYLCSVSGCKSKRKGIVFCSVQCWDEHKAVLNHRSAWAEEQTSPNQPETSDGRAPKRTIVGGASSSSKPSTPETLVVVSKVKKLIKDLSDCNTSQCAVDALTDKVVEECRKAIRSARADMRKTVMGRDFTGDSADS